MDFYFAVDTAAEEKKLLFLFIASRILKGIGRSAIFLKYAQGKRCFTLKNPMPKICILTVL